MEEVERDLILETLSHCLGNRTRAAEILGISIRTLRNKLHEYRAAGAAVPPVPGQAPDSPAGRIARGIDRDRRTGCGRAQPGQRRGAGARRRPRCSSVLVVPLPTVLLDASLAISITVSVLVLMVALFLRRPLDFTPFPPCCC